MLEGRCPRYLPALLHPLLLIAAHLNNGTDQLVRARAVCDGTVDAIDATAQQYNIWGSATQPGSQRAAIRATLLASPEYAAVAACAARTS